MTRGRRLAGTVAGAIAAAVLWGAGVTAQPAKPDYLPYVEFSPEDTPQQIALKQGYNEAIQRYNQTLYDYVVTLERHNRLADAHNNSADPAERKRARDEAQPLRVRLEELRRAVTARAAAVDQAARRAAAGGVSTTR